MTTRSFAYRCGGSDGLAGFRRTVFPFNPMARIVTRHLQDRREP